MPLKFVDHVRATMMWLFLALGAQLISAIVVLIDRRLVGRRAFDHPAVYAFYVGILSSVVLVLAPFEAISRPNGTVLFLSLGAGVSFLFGILFFYRALHHSEPSDSAPIYGVATAIVTFVLSLAIFSDSFGYFTLAGVIVLIVGAASLAYARIDRKALINLALAGVFAGVSSILFKILFYETTFANGFFWSRMAQVFAALLWLIAPRFRQVLRERTKQIGTSNYFWVVGNKALAGIATLLILLAIRSGNVAVVNAMVGWQFAFLVMIAALRGHHVSRGKIIAIVLMIVGFAMLFMQRTPPVPTIDYGVSFSSIHARELGLDWKPTFEAILGDLGVKRVRLSAYWNIVEPTPESFDFKELDEQMRMAETHHASVILAMGRRLPGWPECREPDWIDASNRREEILAYIEQVVTRYQTSIALESWQVENEPFLASFAPMYCGELDRQLFDDELALVRRLDPTRQITTTDGGEFGKWYSAYRAGDRFGTTMYLYIWSPLLGQVRYPIVPEFFQIKSRMIRFLTGQRKPVYIAELGAEPWLLHPIIETPIETQLSRMGMDKFNEVIAFARRTNLSPQYLWGAEWWYWMKLQGQPEFWDRARELFKK